MSPEDQRVAIAEACGWKDVLSYATGVWGIQKGYKQTRFQVPDYLNDLNAMFEAEETLPANHTLPGNATTRYEEQLAMVQIHQWEADCKSGLWPSWHATAAQRAEAFLRTIGQWISEQHEER